MKKIIVSFLLVFSTSGMSQLDQVEIISVKNVILTFDIRKAKLTVIPGIFYREIYGRGSYISINVPELNGQTTLNHNDASNSGPWLTNYGSKLSDLTQNGMDVVKVPFEITLEKKINYSNNEIGFCRVYLSEDISTNLRNITFTHSKAVKIFEGRCTDFN